MGEIVEPSNLEIMTLLRAHVSSAERRDQFHVERNAELKSLITSQGSRIEEIHERVGRVEVTAREAKDTATMAAETARKAVNSQTDLEGSLLAEVGALAANDKAQNAALTAIKAETHEQTKTLGDQTEKLDALAKAEDTRKTREDVVFWILTRALPAIAVGTGGAIVWLFTHFH